MCRDIYVALPLKRHKCRGAYFQNKTGAKCAPVFVCNLIFTSSCNSPSKNHTPILRFRLAEQSRR